MKNLLVITIAICLPIVASAQETKNSSATDEAEILKNERDWALLAVKGDTAAMLAMGTDDAVFVLSSGDLTPLKDFVADMKSGAIKLESMHIDELKVRVYGEAAVVFGLETEKSTYKGDDSSGQYRFTDTWIKKNGRWLCLVSANTLVTPAKK